MNTATDRETSDYLRRDWPPADRHRWEYVRVVDKSAMDASGTPRWYQTVELHGTATDRARVIYTLLSVEYWPATVNRVIHDARTIYGVDVDGCGHCGHCGH